MANGINPLTGESIPDNELINNVRISRCLFYVNDILGEVLINGGIQKNVATTNRPRKNPFTLNKEKLTNFEYSDIPIPISTIVQKINNLNTNPDMYKLKTTHICNWLINMGILVETEINGKIYKLPTQTGKDMGLYVEERIGYNGEYYIVQYPKQMQEFIIDNFDNLLEYMNK